MITRRCVDHVVAELVDSHGEDIFRRFGTTQATTELVIADAIEGYKVQFQPGDEGYAVMIKNYNPRSPAGTIHVYISW